jgi:signal peptidase I
MREVFNFLVWVTFIGAVIGAGLYAFVIEVWTVPSDDPLFASSIEPTIHAGDVLVVMKQPSIERGNLVRCPDPQSAGRFVVGRAVARGGEELQIVEGSITVDHSHTSSPRGCDAPLHNVFDPATNQTVALRCAVQEYAGRDFEALMPTGQHDPSVSVTVEAGKWFLVSDDRHIHLDSRDFGAVEPGRCQRLALRLYGAGGLGDGESRFTFIW